ncbi:MAG: uroporphyrinogen-III synthase [Myxococcota bacterium]|nr:uroporphyrinogen-III synthase [Myxococcota bacterium]
MSAAEKNLIGLNCVVTRDPARQEALAMPLRAHGAEVLSMPLATLAPCTLLRPLREEIDTIARGHARPWLLATSAPALSFFTEALIAEGISPAELSGWRGAYVGAKSAAAAKRLGLPAGLHGEKFSAEGLFDALIAQLGSLQGERFLFPRAKVADPKLIESLHAAGAFVHLIPLYEAHSLPVSSASRARLLDDNRRWCVTLCSAETASRFRALWREEEWVRLAPRLRFASIGPSTSTRLRALKLSVDCEAKPHSLEGLIASIEAAWAAQKL